MFDRIFFLCLTAALLVATACAPAPSPSVSTTSDDIADVIAKYREEFRQRMQQENMAGWAVIVVDDQNILWAEGFGYTD